MYHPPKRNFQYLVQITFNVILKILKNQLLDDFSFFLLISRRSFQSSLVANRSLAVSLFNVLFRGQSSEVVIFLLALKTLANN